MSEDGVVELADLLAKKLKEKDRDALSGGEFAFPRLRKLPIHDEAHVRNAMSRFNQTQGMTPEEKSAAKAKIVKKAKEFGIDTKGFAASVSASIASMVFTIHARSLDLPDVSDHPNRMPFSGILTKVGLPSDEPPNGSNGKRVLLTRECCEAALDSLLGMGVDLSSDMKGHDAKFKIGVITSASIDGDDLNIQGFLYAADFPREALKVHLNQADLGFSFEAQNLSVESLEDDPLIVKNCVFTGAAILMKNSAAYQTTAIAAAKAQEREQVDEIKQAVAEAIAAALGPVAKQIGEIAAAQKKSDELQTDLSGRVDKITEGSTLVMANAAVMSKIEPHAKALEAEADRLEADGIGVHSTRGHVANLRRMAGAMRADAATGKTPHEYHDSGSYWAGADPNQRQQQQQQTTAPAVTETPEFKAMQAAFDKLKKDTDDAIAAAETKAKDQEAALKKLTASTPERKTLSPAVSAVLSRYGLDAPEEGKQIAIGTLDKALASAGLDTAEKMRVKTALGREGVLSLNGSV